MHHDQKDIIVTSDVDLEAIILHEENIGRVKVVMHALRSLSPAEKGYSQINKEALGIIFMVKSVVG